MQKVIAIVGPTASGKTALAISLAKKFNGEIISADSRAVYRGLDIGTAKPTKEEQRQVKHHLIDVTDLGSRFTVVEFQKQALAAIRDILRRGRLPFLVGGTGLYVDAVLQGYVFPPVADKDIENDLLMKSDKELLAMLQKLDPGTFETIDRNNRRRVIRALAVVLSTKQSFTQAKKKKSTEFDALVLGIRRPNDELRKRFDERLNEWMVNGLVEEVKSALRKTSPEWMRSLGLQYRYMTDYILGVIELDEAIEATKRSNYYFIKRQMTWFKRNQDIYWVKSYDEARGLVKDFLLK